MMLPVSVDVPTGPGGFDGLDGVGLGLGLGFAQTAEQPCPAGQVQQYDGHFDEYYCVAATGAGAPPKPAAGQCGTPVIKGVSNCVLFAAAGVLLLGLMARR